MSDRADRAAARIAEVAARFIERESNRKSLVTVTRADLAPNFANATIYVTVLPDDQTTAALFFLKRQMTDLRETLAKELRLPRIPNLEVKLDRGEKNRQGVDEAMRRE